MKLLEKLYVDTLKDSNSKYAKKRIQVDIKVLLRNLQMDTNLKFT